MGVFGAPVSVVRAPPASADHTRMVPRLHDGRSVTITPIWNHARQNGRRSEPRASGISSPTTGIPHNGRSYHFCTTSACTTELAQRAFRERNLAHHIEKGVPITLPERRTAWASAAALP